MHSQPFIILTFHRFIISVVSLLLFTFVLSCNSGDRDAAPYVVVYTALVGGLDYVFGNFSEWFYGS